jgi:spermidine/putrescine transport system permease protein
MMQEARRRVAIGFLTTPAYVWLTVTVLLPLSAMLFFSFLTVAPIGGREAQLTTEHYLTFIDKDFYRTLTWRSLRLGFDVTLACVLIGYPAALGLAKYVRGRWREAIFLLIILPFWSNALVRVYSWTMVMREGGFLDWALHWVAPNAPVFSVLFTYPAIVIGLVHSYLPYVVLTCYISLEAIDDSLMEAARSLGASAVQVFLRVILPLSLPGLLVGVILTFIPVIGSFMEPRILGGRAGIMLGTVIEDQFTTVFNWPRGAALSFIMLGIVLLIFAASAPLLRGRLKGL